MTILTIVKVGAEEMLERKCIVAGAIALGIVHLPSAAQEQTDTCQPQGMFAQPDYVSVEALPDGRVTFRLCAPEADAVRVVSNDIDYAIPMGMAPGSERGLPMTRDGSGLWSATTSVPVDADTYRYNFEVNGARVPDPLATSFSRERAGINSTFEITGPAGEFQTWRPEVSHGAVSRIEYWSDSLDTKREAFVYTPPGYMNGSESYPVLYLVHGAGDSADSWTSVGRAHNILDNLLAEGGEGGAEEMIIVMPFGHTPPREGANLLANTDFGEDLTTDLIPHIDTHFRTVADAEHRAMAGLSMGGSHTIRFGLTRPDLFDHIGIFSMGLGMGENDVAEYTAANDAALRRAAQELDLVYYAMGTEDFLYGTVEPTRALLNEYNIEHVYKESGGGHTWINWRRYLHDFLPRLFR